MYIEQGQKQFALTTIVNRNNIRFDVHGTYDAPDRFHAIRQAQADAKAQWPDSRVRVDTANIREL